MFVKNKTGGILILPEVGKRLRPGEIAEVGDTADIERAVSLGLIEEVDAEDCFSETRNFFVGLEEAKRFSDSFSDKREFESALVEMGLERDSGSFKLFLSELFLIEVEKGRGFEETVERWLENDLG